MVPPPMMAKRMDLPFQFREVKTARGKKPAPGIVSRFRHIVKNRRRSQPLKKVVQRATDTGNEAIRQYRFNSCNQATTEFVPPATDGRSMRDIQQTDRE